MSHHPIGPNHNEQDECPDMAKRIDAQNSYPVTVREALSTGVSRYYTGKPCKHGHITYRYTANRACSTCQDINKPPSDILSARRKRTYTTNKEHEGELSAIWYRNNKARKRKARAVWSVENADSIKITQDIWNLANPEIVRAISRNRRARKAKAGGSHTGADIEFLMRIQGGRCAHSWCRKSLSSYKEVDHIIPIALGGSNDRKNLQLLCRRCNRTKLATHPIDFAQRFGLLL